MDPIDAYRALRGRVDEHEAAAVGRGADLRCGAGCEACCHVSLAVSPLEAAELAAALRALDDGALAEVVARLDVPSAFEHAGEHEGSVDVDGSVDELEDELEDDALEDDELEDDALEDDALEDDELEDDELEDAALEDDELEDDDVRCVMLGDDGRCAVYAARPLVCRSQGLPLAYPNDVVPVEAVRARAGDKALVWCPLNFTARPPTGPDVLDAGRLDEALALLNRAFVGEGDPLVRIDLRDLVAAAARERTVR